MFHLYSQTTPYPKIGLVIMINDCFHSITTTVKGFLTGFKNAKNSKYACIKSGLLISLRLFSTYTDETNPCMRTFAKF